MIVESRTSSAKKTATRAPPRKFSPSTVYRNAPPRALREAPCSCGTAALMTDDPSRLGQTLARWMHDPTNRSAARARQIPGLDRGRRLHGEWAAAGEAERVQADARLLAAADPNDVAVGSLERRQRQRAALERRVRLGTENEIDTSVGDARFRDVVGYAVHATVREARARAVGWRRAGAPKRAGHLILRVLGERDAFLDLGAHEIRACRRYDERADQQRDG